MLPTMLFIAGGFPGGSDSKSICLQCWRPRFVPWVRKIPWKRKWQTIAVLLPGKFHGLKPLESTQSDMTEQLHIHFHTFFSVTCQIIKKLHI